MARIVVEGGPLELRFHREQWEAVASELVELGHSVELERSIEQRGYLPEIPPGEPLRIIEIVNPRAGEPPLLRVEVPYVDVDA
ncbi:MAG TPA: hypothetical protein VFU99_07145 [Gaiellaceae bacterium]|nr:hypothetical protein [Gaiellaceae bacterium]